jgi:hypothetical protein
MTTTEISPAKSIFASIDRRSDEFSDDVELAKNFTRLVLGWYTFSAEGIVMVHLTSEDESPKKDDEGKEYFRRYAIWKENQNHFGAWVFMYVDEEDEDKVLYPQILGPVAKKSHQIVEDVYYIEKLGLPIAWVTYHNAQ